MVLYDRVEQKREAIARQLAEERGLDADPAVRSSAHHCGAGHDGARTVDGRAGPRWLDRADRGRGAGSQAVASPPMRSNQIFASSASGRTRPAMRICPCKRRGDRFDPAVAFDCGGAAAHRTGTTDVPHHAAASGIDHAGDGRRRAGCGHALHAAAAEAAGRAERRGPYRGAAGGQGAGNVQGEKIGVVLSGGNVDPGKVGADRDE
ncbi:MAG: hypothetical protein MZV63_28775 [Marinilabiliales bacterium]|nr:hypothetical protein [Marinilabiliales bacterium]